MYENDALQIVPASEITAILSCLKPLFPKSIHAYYFIDNLLKWKKKVPEEDIAILTPKGGHQTGAVFFYYIGLNHLTFSAYIWNKKGGELLRNALLDTKRFPWAEFKYVLVTCLTEEVYTALEPALTKVLSTRSSPAIGHDMVYWLPAEEVIKFDVKVPDGMRLDELKEEHAERINSVWPHRSDGSVEMMKLMMWVNFGKGLFNSNGELAAWAFYWFFGALGVVQTAESERRKGYGKVVVQAVCKEMGLRGLDVHLNIVEGNTVSEAFFKSLDFKHAFNSVWLYSVQANEQKT
uniref:GCN5-related N-acetyltransferase Rv2170-like domain-containing protein n=1 Tax=Panstrongylus lignarius TaxID=156445 RepID=A0A224XT86_9HEMI